MRRFMLGLGIVLGLSSFASECRAQNFSDPFFLYYGYFLPRQQAMAATPTYNDTLNAVTAARQGNATTNRSTLYDPNGNLAPLDDFDSPAAQQRRQDPRGGRIARGGFPTGNITGTGPGEYYNRTSRFYPTLRTGVGPNRNVGAAGPRAFAGGGAPNARAMMNPGGGMGMPGPR